MVNLRQLLQKRLLDGMIRKIGGTSWKVLVVDREALRILAAGVKINDLSKEGVTVIEMLDLRREPLPRIPAIYFVSPTPETIQLLIGEKKHQYKEFHLFFTRRVPDFQMGIIKGAASFLKRVKTFIELETEFLACESSVFSLDRLGASLPQLYNGNKKERLAEITAISERLTELCKLVGLVGEWTVRYDNSSSTSKMVASLVKEQIEAAQVENRAQEKEESQQEPGRKFSLLILDRATDILSPLLHEFTYQAMAHDLLPLDYRQPGGPHYEIESSSIENDAANDSKGKGKRKKLPLEDEDGDDLWRKVRHMHVEEARGLVSVALKEFLENDPAAKVHAQQNGGGGPLDIKDLSAAIRALPSYKEAVDRHDLHISAIQECLSQFRTDHLEAVASIEQDIAMGRDAESERIRGDQFLDQLEAFLGRPDISVKNKCRVVLMATAVGESQVGLGGEASLLSSSNAYKRQVNPEGAAALAQMGASMQASLRGLQMLVKSINAEAETAASNLRALAMSNTHDADRRQKLQKMINLKKKYKERKVKKRKENARRRRLGLDEQTLPYALSRYVPPVRSVAFDFVDHELDASSFPVCGGVSVNEILAGLNNPRNKNATLAAGRQGSNESYGASSIDSTESTEEMVQRTADPDHVYIVFFVGGVCYSEIRTVYETKKVRQANMLIGGSNLLTPQNFVDAMAAISDPTIRLKVMLPPLPLDLARTRMADRSALENAKTTSDKQSEKPSEAPVKNDVGRKPAAKEFEVVAGYQKKSFKRSVAGMFGRKKY